MISMVLDLIGGRKTLYSVAVGLVVGLLVGWFALGWWIAPIGWTDAGPANLEPSYQKQFVRAIADAYSVHGDVALV